MTTQELAQPTGRDFCAYGDGAQLFQWLDGTVKPPTRECIFEGIAGGGKTRTVMEFLVECCLRYPGTKIFLLRNTRRSMNESVLDCLETEVLGDDHPIVRQGRDRAYRDKYAFGNKSEIVLGGMDNPTKQFSTQFNIIWFNEVQEIEEADWEYMHRALRRPRELGGPPFYLLGGDCNPDTETHWANQRCLPSETGKPKATRLISRFWDNPRYYDHFKQEWTPEGNEYLEELCQGLSGVRYERLFKGRWVAAEGMVWETFDPRRHVITARLEGDPRNGFTLYKKVGINEDGTLREQQIRLTWFMASHDFGTTNPGSMQVWGFDDDQNMYLVAEHYHSRKDYDWWAERAVEFYREFRYKIAVCDHAPAAIPVLNARCALVEGREMPALWRRWDKVRGEDGEKTGIDQVRVRFRQDAMFIVRGALRQVDNELRKKRKPTCLEEEIPQYVYPVTQDGKRHKETPDPGCANHAADAARGAASYGFLKDFTARPAEKLIKAPAGSVEYQYQVEMLKRERAPKKKRGGW